MKKLHLFLFVAALSCLAIGCRKPVEVSFGVESLNIAAEGGTYTVELKSNGEWSLSAIEEWLVVTPSSGNGNATLSFEARPNTTSQPRNIEVKATTKDNTASLTIQQEGTSKYITLSPSSMLGDWEGGTFQVVVQSNMAWTVTTLPDWVHCSALEGEGNDTVQMTMLAFLESGTREAYITFGDGNISTQFRVRQSGTSEVQHFLNVVPNEIQLPYVGGDDAMVFRTGDEAVIDVDWVALDKTEGSGNDVLVLTVAENPLIEARQTCIKFVSDSHNSVVVDIFQEGAPDPHFLDVAPSALNFEKGGGSQEIAVACDTEWTADFSGDWLSLSTTVGMGNGNLTITVAPNVYNEARQTFVAIASGNLTRRVMVAQEPGDEPLVASVSPDTLYVAQVGGVKMFEITSNTNWTLSAPSWITMLDVSGTGDATIEMMVDVNRTYSSRVGYITVMHNGMELSRVAIVQEGIPPILSVDVEEIVFTREGGTQYFNLTSNMSWTIENPEEWLVCSPTEGSGNTEVVVKAVPMDEVGSREVVLVIRGSLGQTVNVVVRQNS